jgi:hypothetical protein
MYPTVHLASTPARMSVTLTLTIDLYAIAEAYYPFSERLAFNPIRDRCFQIAAMNETWFLTIIYCSARQLATSNSSILQYSRDAAMLMEKVLERLRRSIEMTSKGELPSDEIICAIACLTTLEVYTRRCHYKCFEGSLAD